MAGLSFPLKVELVDGDVVDVIACAPDQIRLERRFNLSFASLMPPPLVRDGVPVLDADGDQVVDMSESELRIDHLAFLAWSALRRARDERASTDYEVFVTEQLLGVDMVDDTPKADAGAGAADPETNAGSAG